MREATNEFQLKSGLITLPRGLHRFTVIGLVGLALAVSMGAALISLFKLWVLLAFVAVIVVQWQSGQRPWGLAWPKSMRWLFALWAWMSLTVFWSSAESRDQILAFDRYSRFLVLPVVWYLFAKVRALDAAMRGFVGAQLLVLISSFALMAGMPVPWATAKAETSLGVVFTSTLEQPIMLSLMAWVLFQFGESVLSPRMKNLKWILIALTLFNVFFLSTGRSGYVAGGLVVFLMAFQAVPKKWGWLAFAVPVLMVATAFTFSSRVQTRITVVYDEVSQYLESNQLSQEQLGSQGQRLNYWARSIDMVRDQPILGVGLGAWRMNYLKYGGLQSDAPSNPHQQYLLMAAEGGVIGLVLLLGWLIQLWRDAGRLTPPNALKGVLWVAVVVGFFNCPFFGVGMGEMLLLLFALLLNNPSEAQA
ncbi:MAG: hypothetical protein RL307_171 [Pseudomonadota bacterium]